MSEITTAAELDALPPGVIVRSAAGTIACRHDGGMGVCFGVERPFEWDRLALPLTVLYRPDRPALPTVQPTLTAAREAAASAVYPRLHWVDLTEEAQEDMTDAARAILALIGGRTEAEVKAKALEEAATSLEGGLGVEGTPGTLYEYRAWLRARAAAIRGEQ